ncbi:MAG: S41 family peptidase, partial [Clostridia bacterium]|nr:S41 family peptidase [Clostridia bacterium]
YHVYEPDNSIGVIQISGFERNTPEQFVKAVDSLKADGVKKLIFDVRYNPGGDKDAVCDILDYLLPEGDLLRTVDAEGKYTTVETSDKKFLDMPMAVVMNSGTASAGELFAAAIKDYGAGKLVGEQTYGKGSMQSIMPVFDDGSLLKLTVALYCPPTSENYDGVGIAPDVAEPLDESLTEINFHKLTDANDNQLRAAAKTFE